jgi:hypothetical protein
LKGMCVPTDERWKFMSRKVIGREDNPMLIRWRLIQTPIGGIYLHFIHREDLDRMPHDHPWTFASIVLRGGYQEEFWPEARLIGQEDGHREDLRDFTRGRFHLFRQRSAHRIVYCRPHTTTLVLVGRKNRTWGFYDGQGRFIDWRDYHEPPGGWSPHQRRQLGLVP